MFRALKNALSVEKLEAIERRVVEAAEAGQDEAAWKSLQPLLRAQRHQREAAIRLARIVERRCLTIDNALAALTEIERAHSGDLELLGVIGEALEGARDIDQLNLAPPEHSLFERVVDGLAEAAGNAIGTAAEPRLLSGLATAARMLARQRDEVAEASHKRLIELDPANGSAHYNYGLFLKTRGRFDEGLRANQAALRLAREPVESYEWNLGICATGAGQGETALEVWRRMGQKIEMGRFGLPEGGYPQCKLRLAERPLAERTAETDDPGHEETIWIQRLSPCHGIVRSVLYQDLGVDFGDVVLFDGAPITYHTYGDAEIPVFPHLATLVRRGYQRYDFAGTQDEPRRLADASLDLADDAIVYSHSENYRVLCASCWRDPDIDHERHDEVEWHVVTGRIAAPPHIDPAELLSQLDAALASRSPCAIYAPTLCEAAGLAERAAVERRRFELLRNN
jgi:tetratricopeptide (TPR) repeat protein